jgi:hypothetical protein
MTYRGLMSCACRQLCESRMGGGARRHAQVCWDWASPEARRLHAGGATNLSALPDVPATALIFRTPSWPPIGRCARPDPPRHCGSKQGKKMHAAANTLGGWPLPNSRCPLSCSHRGTCILPMRVRQQKTVERYPLAVPVPADGRPPPTCICHMGYSGSGCEKVDYSQCFNRCSGHGVCTGRFCLCAHGWQGVDCSLRAAGSADAAQLTAAVATSIDDRQREGGVRFTAEDRRNAGVLRRGPATVPIYAYALPTEMSMEGVYQRDMHRRGQYYANLMFYEQLHARGDAVANPEEAALYFVPVMVMQMAGNLWHPYEFLRRTVHYLTHAHPYWNRSAGTDHVFFLTTDRGGCWKPWALQHSIIVSYLGFRASEGYFGFEERLKWPRQGPNNRNNAYSTKRGAESLGLDCYVPEKDVVVPVDASIGAVEEAKLPPHGTPFACKRGPHKVLLFMGGSMSNMGRIEYSQGVRQAIQQIHANESQFVLGGQFTLDDLRASRFCLAPSGWGWGWRLSLAVATQCVPVIIQPNVTQPWEDLLEGTPYSYDTFSIRLAKEDIPQLPAILRAVPLESLCAKQAMLARVYRAFLWQQPSGPSHASAYDLMQILLCRRAKSLAVRYARDGKHPQAFLARHAVQCAETLEAAGIRFD